MDEHLIHERRIRHCDQQRRTRLEKKKIRQQKLRRVNTFKCLLESQASTRKCQPKHDHKREPEATSNNSTMDQDDFLASPDPVLVSSDGEDCADVIENDLSSCLVNVSEDSRDEPVICEREAINSSSEDSNEEHEALSNTRLHLHTKVTILDCCKDLSTFLRRANVNKSHSSSLLKFIKSLLPVPNNMPCSTENLLSLLGVRDLFVKRAVCLVCNQYFEYGKSQCPLCQVADEKQIARVFDLDIYESMKTIVGRLSSDIEDYKRLISDTHLRSTSNDIPFHRLYRELLNRNPTQNPISLLLHLDGIGLTKSTQLKLWLFSGSIVELPAKLRHRRYNMILMSMWIGYAEPKPELWLKPIIDELQYVKTRDIVVKNHSYKLKVYGITGDCPALKKILNFIGHNGYDCCWFCRIHGQHEGGKRQYYYQRPIHLRSRENYLKESTEAHRTKSRVNGHLGRSVIQDLVDLPLPDSIVIDYLHVTLLGHFKAISIDIYNRLLPRQRAIFNEQLKRQRFPHFFKRKTRPFTEFSYFKAIEFRNLLFYGVLPGLQSLIPLETLAHLALFVCSIRLLHRRSPFNDDTSAIADALFTRFYEDHGRFYDRLKNFVLHLHVHYARMYVNHGALSNIGCFGQEDLIGYVSSNRHGTSHFGELITHYYSIDFHLHNRSVATKAINGPKDRSNHRADFYDDIDRFHALLCTDGCHRLNDCFVVYRRFTIHDQMFHSLIYNRAKQSMSYFVQYLFDNDANDRRFGIIELFFTFEQCGYAIVQHYPCQHLYSDCFKQSRYYGLLGIPLDCFFFILEKQYRHRDLVQTSWIVNHCVVIEMTNSLFVTPISTYDEHD